MENSATATSLRHCYETTPTCPLPTQHLIGSRNSLTHSTRRLAHSANQRNAMEGSSTSDLVTLKLPQGPYRFRELTHRRVVYRSTFGIGANPLRPVTQATVARSHPKGDTTSYLRRCLDSAKLLDHSTLGAEFVTCANAPRRSAVATANQVSVLAL